MARTVLRYSPYALVPLLLALCIVLFVSNTVQRAQARALNTPSSSAIELALYRAGITPQTLAASGVAAGDVEQIIINATAHVSADPDAMQIADNAHAALKTSVSQLERRVRAFTATEQEAESLPGLRTQLQTAANNRTAVEDDIFSAATADLTNGQINGLLALRLNRADWHLPLQYMTGDRTEADWVALRGALAEERIHTRLGEEIAAEITQLLAAVRAEAETMSAAGLDNRQLRHALKSGVEAVLGLHEAFEKARAAARA